MPFPSETFVGMFPSELQMVGDELRAQGSQLTGYLSAQHKNDGSHGNVTAESLDVSDDTSLHGRLVLDGTTVDPNDSRFQVSITRETVAPSMELATLLVGQAPILELSSVDAPTTGLSPVLSLAAGGGARLQLRFDSAGSGVDALLFLQNGGMVQTNNGYKERNRTVAVGEWTAVPFSAGNFTASAGTWTVSSGNQATYKYTLVGKTMTLTWIINASSCSSAATLRLAIPGGFVAATTQQCSAFAISAGGARVPSLVTLAAGTAFVTLFADTNGSNFAISAGNAYSSGTVAFEVQ